MSRAAQVTLHGGTRGDAMRKRRSVGVVCVRVLTCSLLALVALVALFSATGCQLSSDGSATIRPRRTSGPPTVRRSTSGRRCPGPPATAPSSSPSTSAAPSARPASREVPCTSERAAARVVARYDGTVDARVRCARRPPTSCCTSANSGPPPTRTATGRSRRATPACAILGRRTPATRAAAAGRAPIVGDCVYGTGRGPGARDGVRRDGRQEAGVRGDRGGRQTQPVPVSTALYVQLGGERPVGCARPV